jgi:hypothetical protein
MPLVIEPPVGCPLADGGKGCGGVRRDRVMRPVVALGTALTGFCVLAVPAAALGFGQRYDLPLPLSSMVAFVLLVLSSVLYDGLLTTPEWAEAERQLIVLNPVRLSSGPSASRRSGWCSSPPISR